MSGKINRYVCKNCGRIFEYDEYSFRLKAERGESRIERCEECRRSHGIEIKETKSPYFAFQQEIPRLTIFTLSDLRFTSRGERTLEIYPTKVDFSKIKFGITDEDILKLYEKLEENQVVVVTAPTGSGKSTLIACRLIISPEEYKGDLIDRLVRQGKIAITQPLTAAVQRIPETNADLIGSGVGPGHILGLRHGTQTGGQEGERFDRWNIELTVTDGSLRNWIRDGRLNEYSVIMVDEAHQRSCNIETILMLLKNELPRYPNLKVIISSATVNAERFRDTFKEIGVRADILNLDVVSKRKHNYYVHFWKDEQAVQGCDCWLCQSTSKRKAFWAKEKDTLTEFELPETITRLVVKILEETEEGSILVFLHGEAIIKDTVRKIRNAKRRIDPSNKIPVLPVYRRLKEKEVEKHFNLKGEKRRVLVTTNIAETSHTLDDVVYVIDSGYIKESEWDPDTQISTLPTKRHSQDGCRQRWGRVGRNQDGYVFCLYTEEEFKSFEPHTPSEVIRSSLDEVMLNLSASGITNPKVIPWLVKPEDFSKAEDRKKWQKELQRANNAISENQFVSRNGLVTEKAQEIFHVPRSANDIDILALADEYNCALETAITLFLMATRDGEPRTGANLYAQDIGLLLWDTEWVASTKMKVWLLHQGLKLGCRDDLDFVVKLAYCFLKAEEKGVAREWADYYQVNYQRVKDSLDSAKDTIGFHYRSKAQEEPRNLDASVLERVRQVLTIAWRSKLVDIRGGTPPIYPLATKGKVGVVSSQCSGRWQKRTKAIVATAVEKQIVVKGYPQEVPNASFMVALSGQASDIFLDQRFPVGAWVEVKEEKGKTYLSRVEEVPSPIRISFKKSVWAGEGKKEKIVSFDQRFIFDEPHTGFPQGVWFGQKTANRARIVEWAQQDGIPVAILTSFTESDISKLGKLKGHSLKVKVHRVVRDPVGKNGWASTRISWFEIPVELSELSLSDWGPGLEQLEGRSLILTIKDFDADGFPQLSNLKRIKEDLKDIRKVISESEDKERERPYIPLLGFVAEIIEDQERTVVIIPRENGILHPFEIAQAYVPGSNLKNLRVNEEVLLHVFSQTNSIEIASNDLTDEEIENRPKEWKIKQGEDKLLVPACLEDKDVENWPARLEAKDYVKQRSWQYCLQARIVSLKERLSRLNKMDLVEGKIQEINYEEDGKTVKSVQVVISGDVPGFAFGRDLGSLRVSEGDIIPFYIRAVDPNTGFLKLVSKHYEDEKRKKQEEFRKRTQEHIKRWENNIRKSREAIRKIRQNIAKNKARPIRTKEFEDRVKLWIAEDEKRIRNIELSIQNWLDKIEAARRKLED